MKTRLLSLLVFLVLALPLRAQWSEDLDTLCQARLMVMYELTYREDTNHMDRAKKERMLLLIGDENRMIFLGISSRFSKTIL